MLGVCLRFNDNGETILSGMSQRPVEAIVDPDLRIIDTHIHLWHRDAYFAPDFLADVGAGHNVTSSVYVECSMAYSDDPREEFRPVGENRFVLEQVALAGDTPHRLAEGILAAAELPLGEKVRPILEAHTEASSGRLRGVRYRVAWDPDPVAGYGEIGYPTDNVLTLPAFRDGARCLADMGLVLDVWGFHTQLADIARFAAAIPTLTLVVDHVGGPLGVGPYAGRRAEVFELWARGIDQLAEVPNIWMKLSGLAISRIGFGFQDNGQAASSDELVNLWGPYIRKCIDAFGPQRCIFGSNYPVDRAAAPYPVLLNAYKKMLADLSPDDKRMIFSENARTVYRLL